MSQQRPGSSADDNHISWIAAARREADALRAKSTHATPAGSSSKYLSDVDLRRTLDAELTGYAIREDVFRGGQGVVFRATQIGTRRDVAIKMLREGPLVGTHGVARFEREVQILSQLRHPNIVSILETGRLSGSYFFVMDFVEGWSLDDYIVEKRPTAREVLELFAHVCDAVNVAHLRGVIHRDLKPGNVRVDRSGSPHVLDFGLAKVDENDDFGAAMTVTGQFVGSLPWASPEQVEATPEGIDIRTDVYSIGVMLYHALAGRFPYPVGESFRQTIDHICHTTPERPGSIREELDDEIDQIVLKCLRKERDLRYQTAGGIAKDIRRYLVGEAIEAKRDSAWYVVRKALKKHRVTATFIGLFVGMIVFAIGCLIYLYDVETTLRHEAEVARDSATKQAIAAAEARDEAMRQRGIADEERIAAEVARDEALHQKRITDAVNEFFNGDVLASVAPDALGRDVTVREALDAASENIDERFAEDPLIRGQVKFVLGNTYFRLGVLDRAERHLADARDIFVDAFGPDDDTSLMALNDVARAYAANGKYNEAVDAFGECLERRLRINGPDNLDTLSAQTNMGWLLATLGRYREAEPYLLDSYETRKRVFGEEHPQSLAHLNNIAMFYHQIGELDKAADASERELAISRRIDPDDPGIFTSLSNLAAIYASMRRYDRAEALYIEALEGRRKALGESHPSTLLTTNNLATLYTKIDRIDDAADMYVHALEKGLEEHDESLPIVQSLRSNLGWIRNYQKRFQEAEPLHAAAVDNARRILPEGHPTLGLYIHRYGECLMGLARYSDAEKALLEAYSILSNQELEDHHELRDTARSLAALCEKLERPDETAKWTQIADREEAALAAE
ncbi:MAG TPA: serine/threonine-protein kinase [Phycisphaerae bacterium]|nr:serine/threonine-protein kinase [Phycisphaerae bacterium]HRW53104.1 serine/threonine-protein kinase [Phycisphaerae bacterium]